MIGEGFSLPTLYSFYKVQIPFIGTFFYSTLFKVSPLGVYPLRARAANIWYTARVHALSPKQ